MHRLNIFLPDWPTVRPEAVAIAARVAAFARRQYTRKRD
jgi:hypothetical protein